MQTAITFLPPRQRGALIHLGLLTLPIFLGGFTLVKAIQTRVGPLFFSYLLIFSFMTIITLRLIYQVYALFRSAYTIEREGIRIQWGLRVENIPMPDILWVRRPAELDQPTPSPWMRIPGALLGSRRAKNLGQVEFLAADPNHLVLIATSDRLYAISPEDSQRFLTTFQELMELGSLAPLPAISLHPSLLFTSVWADRPARTLILISLLLCLYLIVRIATLLPSLEVVSLGFTAEGALRNPVPAVRLTLFPVVNTFFYAADLILGMFFYRQKNGKILAYILWIAGALTSLMFLFALYLIRSIS